MALATYIKDPSAKLPYPIDWSQWLNGDTISMSSWTVPAGLTNLSETNSATQATIKLGGGEVGTTYEVTNHIVTAAGLEDERTIQIQIVNR